MSDFDEEAERERLREQYEQEQQDRQATEKMSELLLQGATMTNAHCSDCGDPVFRYEGQEFCATCEKAIDRGDGDAGANGQAGEGTDGTDGERAEADEHPDAGAEPDDDQIQVASPDETRVQFGAGDEDGTDSAGAGDGPAADERARQPAEGRPRQPAPPRQEPDPDRRRDPASTPRPADTAGEGGLAAARASLERTLARAAQRAEAAEDPTTAREHLAAAREAAEALAALRR
jgi:uncharacterized Zn finger protein (UPF0148 family)